LKGRKVFEEGDLEAGIWAVGTCIGLIQDVPTVKELVTRMVEEAAAIISERLPRVVDRASA
jgi:NAD(P)H-dependent flavin oxidoreductase YrpB (nitropropane dioxygenase family)